MAGGRGHFAPTSRFETSPSAIHVVSRRAQDRSAIACRCRGRRPRPSEAFIYTLDSRNPRRSESHEYDGTHFCGSLTKHFAGSHYLSIGEFQRRRARANRLSYPLQALYQRTAMRQGRVRCGARRPSQRLETTQRILVEVFVHFRKQLRVLRLLDRREPLELPRRSARFSLPRPRRPTHPRELAVLLQLDHGGVRLRSGAPAASARPLGDRCAPP